MLSFAIGASAVWIEDRLGIPPIPLPDVLARTLFFTGLVLAVVLMVWVAISLPGLERGLRLVTTGAYRTIRHPQYAAFLVPFYLGIAFYLESYLVLLSWPISLLLCARLADYEENYMLELFGKEYRDYVKKTKKFIPGII